MYIYILFVFVLPLPKNARNIPEFQIPARNT